MKKAKRNELAWKFLIGKLREGGIRIGGSDFRVQLVSTAKEYGISKKDATEFVNYVVKLLVSETFPKKKRQNKDGA